MTDVTNILYWISTGLMIPVVALLLIGFMRSLALLGGFVSMYIARLKYTKELQNFIEGIRSDPAGVQSYDTLKSNRLLHTHLQQIVASGNDSAFIDKVLADFEAAAEKELSVSKTLSKMGPMIGLMGTLIPMGPALVGLATGDIASMAQNMQVAFSTTVVGLFAGGVGFITQLVKQRWFVEDLNQLEFISKKIRA